jgi:hypothetical protein
MNRSRQAADPRKGVADRCQAPHGSAHFWKISSTFRQSTMPKCRTLTSDRETISWGFEEHGLADDGYQFQAVVTVLYHQQSINVG